jgi:hypothetical protein
VPRNHVVTKLFINGPCKGQAVTFHTTAEFVVGQVYYGLYTGCSKFVVTSID